MSSIKVSIRPGEARDIPAALGLVKALAVYEKEPHAVLVSEAEMHDAAFGPRKLCDFFVAECQEEIIGMALFFEHYSTWTGRAIHLEDLFVLEQHRQRGVGQALFTQVLRVARQRKVRRLQWQVLDWNTPAINFYKKLGASLDPEWISCQLTKEQIEVLLGASNH